MPVESYLDFSPIIASSVFLASSANVIGRTHIGELSSVWYNTTIRGDINEILIGSQTNIQDNAVLHNADDYPCVIGDLVTVGHSAIVHACTIKNEVLIGMGAVILDGAIIGANALVTGGTVIPPGSLVLGSPAKVVRQLSQEERGKVKDWALKYVKQSRIYLEREKEINA